MKKSKFFQRLFPSFTIFVSKHSLVRYREISSAMLLSSSTIKIFCLDVIRKSSLCYLKSTIVTPASPSRIRPDGKRKHASGGADNHGFLFSELRFLFHGQHGRFSGGQYRRRQIFIKLGNGFVYCAAEKIDFCGNTGRLGHTYFFRLLFSEEKVVITGSSTSSDQRCTGTDNSHLHKEGNLWNRTASTVPFRFILRTLTESQDGYLWP